MCTGTFTNKRLLQRHIKLTHSESKAPCSSCGQIFTSSSILRHNKICKMTEEEKQDFKINRRVGCKDCGKVLANKTKLNRHIRFIHNNEKLYQCNLCDRQDYNKDNMKLHIKGIHKERDPNTSFSNIFFVCVSLSKQNIQLLKTNLSIRLYPQRVNGKFNLGLRNKLSLVTCV